MLPPDSRGAYVQTVANLLKPKRYLLLKCFSDQETREAGPYRFTPEEIQQIFHERFHPRSVEQTIYQGTLDPRLCRKYFLVTNEVSFAFRYALIPNSSSINFA
ncbi:MAG: hypothetical protein KME10_29110 [Plectolyngbya sp. WJT66-NPBG17]|nr:hypothetical protein [Plectolyngbya sp. WJT66-NPBG17]